MAETTFRYQRLGEQLAAQIRAGTIRRGDRLPSVRRLSADRGVSVATAVAAYLRLESDGLVEARPRSGYFVRPPAPLPVPRVPRSAAPPAAARVTAPPGIAALMVSLSDSTVFPLGAAQVAPELLPSRVLNRKMAAIAAQSATAGATYGPPAGVPSLRRQMARRALTWGAAIRPDDFVITVGGMEALHLALRAVTRPGDVVAVESPAFFGLLQLLEELALQAVEIPCSTEGGMVLDALEEALRAHPPPHAVKACIASPNFQNPTGSRMSDGDKVRLLRLLERYDVPLIEDDLYGDLALDGTRPQPAQAFDRDGRVLLCGSLSKTLAPGYRIGWIAPGRYQARVEQLKFTQTVATPTLPQMAIAEYLASGHYDRHLRRLRTAFAAQLRRVRQAIARTFPPGTRVADPQGGFLLWIELPPSVDAMALQERALRHRIAIAPGPLFSARRRFRSFMRISCGMPWSPRLEQAIETLGRLATEAV